MIELVYFDRNAVTEAYQVIQFRAGESWRIARDGELLGSVEKLNGVWRGREGSKLAEELIGNIGRLIDAQHFNKLPSDIKLHWPAQVQEVIPSGDEEYLVIAKPEIDFERFVIIFTAYIPHLLKDEWLVLFKLYDAGMNQDWEVSARAIRK
ncbi:hypothetical protein [Pedobacter africanus]|uniref:Uncharacterized protein n=1 Tax=Pedobacter africanus TaxID=151894 RepID=A0A1W2A1L8_9SPHI|nr:hypothetical protein [Pedobacter africanus]SMC54342.1 hypothetical protein SAMN04488524_1145 [Pedobacter africanus]